MNFHKGAEKLKSLLPEHGVSLELRGMLRYLILRGEEKPLNGVEIGVWKGAHAINYLKCLPIQKLYLVDPYKLYQGCDCSWMCTQEDADEALASARKTMLEAGYADKVEFIVDTSENASLAIPEGLDFVYIDGNHDYENARRDLEIYWPKVKWGGVIGGHDFGNDVQLAVYDFLNHPHNSRNCYFPDQDPSAGDFFSLHVTAGPCFDWFIVKDNWDYYIKDAKTPPSVSPLNSQIEMLGEDSPERILSML